MLQATVSEGPTHGPYMTARVGFEFATFRTQSTELTSEPPRKNEVVAELHLYMYTCIYNIHVHKSILICMCIYQTCIYYVCNIGVPWLDWLEHLPCKEESMSSNRSRGIYCTWILSKFFTLNCSASSMFYCMVGCDLLTFGRAAISISI